MKTAPQSEQPETLCNAILALNMMVDRGTMNLLRQQPTWSRLQAHTDKGLDEVVKMNIGSANDVTCVRATMRRWFAAVLVNNLVDQLEDMRQDCKIEGERNLYRTAIADVIRFVVVHLGVMPEDMDLNPVVPLL